MTVAGVEPQWGRYHLTASVLLALLKMPAAWFQLSLLFLAPDIRFRCAQPYHQDNTWGNATKNDSRKVWDQSCVFTGEDGVSQVCSRWGYDTALDTFTVNMNWDLVCERQYLNLIAQLVLMAGVFSGNLFGGLMAARVGRRPVLGVSAVLQPVCGAAVSLAPTFSLFMLSRFLTGLALGGTMVISFALGAEVGNGPYRQAVTILHQVPFGMGQTLVAASAYWLRDWRHLQIALSLYCLIFVPYYWVLEESVQWLQAQGRHKQAQEVREAIKRRNGQPPALTTEMRPIADACQTVQIVKTDKSLLNNNQNVMTTLAADPAPGLCSLFHTPRLCRYTLTVWLLWFCAGLSFFALNAYQTQLGGDPFVNVGIGGLVGGIPGNILTVFLVRKFSKKKLVMFSLLLECFFAILIPVYDVGQAAYDWQRRVLALLTLIAMSVAYPAMFLLTGELMPTVLRASVMGVANLMARLGNTTAPLVGPTAAFHRAAPLCIIAGAPLLSFALMFTLPDSGDGPLPQTVEDVEKNNTSRWPEKTEKAAKPSEKRKIFNPPS